MGIAKAKVRAAAEALKGVGTDDIKTLDDDALIELISELDLTFILALSVARERGIADGSFPDWGTTP